MSGAAGSSNQNDKLPTFQISNINHPRRAIINRKAIKYGQTPNGIRKLHIEKMATELNTDLKTLCTKIITLTEEQRFEFLKSYYENSEDDIRLFFKQFDNFKIQEPFLYKKSSKTKLINKTITTSRLSTENLRHTPNKRVNINDNFHKNRYENKTVSGETSLNLQLLTHSINDKRPQNTDKQIKNASSSTDPYDTVREIASRDDSPSHSQINSTRCDDNTNRLDEDQYKSVLTTILFDDSDSKLKKIMRKQTYNNKSPKKYDTIMETLLFE